MPDLEVVYVCSSCQNERGLDGAICPDCGARGSFLRIERERQTFLRREGDGESEEDGEEERPSSAWEEEEEGGPREDEDPFRPPVVSLGKVKVERFNRTLTGIEGLDLVLGDEDERGVREDNAVAVGGTSGAGKTTMMLRVCANLSIRGEPTTFAACEGEGVKRARGTAARIGLRSRELTLVNFVDLSEMPEGGDRVGYATEVASETRSKILVVDSLQQVVPDALNVRQIGVAAKRFSQYAQKEACAVFMVSHLTSDNDLASGFLGKYLGDSRLILRTIGAGRTPGVQLVHLSCMGKNRGGWTTGEAWFQVSKSGFQEYDPDDEERQHRRDKQDAAASGTSMKGEGRWQAGSRALGRRRR